MFRTLKSNFPFSAPRDNTARASCGNGAEANSIILKSLDRSLMPPGLEAAISIEQMAHLIAFLTGR